MVSKKNSTKNYFSDAEMIASELESERELVKKVDSKKEPKIDSKKELNTSSKKEPKTDSKKDSLKKLKELAKKYSITKKKEENSTKKKKSSPKKTKKKSSKTTTYLSSSTPVKKRVVKKKPITNPNDDSLPKVDSIEKETILLVKETNPKPIVIEKTVTTTTTNQNVNEELISNLESGESFVDKEKKFSQTGSGLIELLGGGLIILIGFEIVVIIILFIVMLLG